MGADSLFDTSCVVASETLGSAPDARAYFFLFRQEKIAKKKASPMCRPAVPGALRCSAATVGCGTRAEGPQTVLALNPVASCAARRLKGQVKDQSYRHRHPHQIALGVQFPLCCAEQRSEAGGSRRALFEGHRPELRSRPASRVAQGSRQSRPRHAGAPFLWLLSFGGAKERMPARQARNPAVQQLED